MTTTGGEFQIAGGARATVQVVGFLVFDGAGEVEGRRTLRRRRAAYDASLSRFVLEYQEVEQVLAGTYTVTPEGLGRLSVTASPRPDWVVQGSSNELRVRYDGYGEQWNLALSDEPCSLPLMSTVVGLAHDTNDGDEFEYGVTLAGSAERHDAGCGGAEPDPRLDELQEEVDLLRELALRQSAQLCEVLRLLHTPQGRRESATAEVLEACGEGFEWNGER
jgi:hypothetical protein